MKKLIVIKRITLILLLPCLLLAGCGRRSQLQPDDAQTIDMAELSRAMLNADSTLPEMKTVSSNTETGKELFTYLSDFDYEKVDAYFLSYAEDGKSYEIAVVALKDSADADALRSSLKKHCRNRVSLYQSYAPDQVPRAEAAELVSSGRYVALIMCDDHEAVKTAFQIGINE